MNIHDIDLSSIRTEQLSLQPANEQHITVDVLRLDTIHPIISGNKWFKLKYYLQEAAATGKKTIVTFGGPWSNHIIATAAACAFKGFRSAGIIRGERPAQLSTVLEQAREFGMELHFINRESFREGKIPASLMETDHYFIPQGGYGTQGVRGAMEIMDYCNKDLYDHICCAVGTGTMMAGLIDSSGPNQSVTGISVMKSNDSLHTEVQRLTVSENKYWRLIHDFHFGGYAKYPKPLLDFMNDLFRKSGIPTDIVYTGKLFFGVFELIRKGFFQPGASILVIHSGGLTGNASLEKGTLIFQ